MKGIVIYKGKYGATHQYAGWLGSALHLPVVKVDNIASESLINYDFLVIGDSVYIGKLRLRDWLKRNIAAIQDKKLFLFIVCGTPSGEKEKLERIATKNIPEEIRSRCDVYFLHGRMIKKEISWMDRMLLTMGAMLIRDPVDKENMLRDFDEVKKENLIPLINAVLTFSAGKKDMGFNIGNAV